MQTLFEYAGGRPALRRFIEMFYASVLVDPVLQPLFGTLDTAAMPADPAFRQALAEHVEFGSQVAMQNSHATSEAELHPLREVPHWSWPIEKAPVQD